MKGYGEMTNFDYAGYMRRANEIEQLLVAADEVTWIERYTPPESKSNVLLYFGCQVMRTPHIARQAVDVMQALGYNCVSTAGMQFCCSAPWVRHGDLKMADSIANHSLDRLSSFKPDLVLMWCPSCNLEFDRIFAMRDEDDPFELLNMTEFLVNELAAGVGWNQRVDRKVALHTHVGRENDPATQERAQTDAKAVHRLLSSIPGLEVVAEYPAPHGFGYQCGSLTISKDIDFDGYQRDEATAAKDAGAQELVTISHACQRSWCAQSTADLKIANYISLVAEALGREVFPDRLAALYTTIAEGGVDAAVTATRPSWESYQISEAEARGRIERYFLGIEDPNVTHEGWALKN